MKVTLNTKREFAKRNPMLYGHFIEHFHRRVYGGVYDPGNALSDAQGLRTDVLEALRKIKAPVLRWPGGCFASSYHWKDAVGPARKPLFDKAWRVGDPNSFGTDEYIGLCRKIGCEPYITGSTEEMSDWVEYCNLGNEGRFAKWRVANGHKKPHGVKYWSIGNENYGSWLSPPLSAACAACSWPWVWKKRLESRSMNGTCAAGTTPMCIRYGRG